MTAQVIADYLRTNVPGFLNPRLLGPGSAYHYTSQKTMIDAATKFLGVALSPNLDCRQKTVVSPPATENPGVVFAYEALVDAAEEGFDCEIFKINFNAAVSALHAQESFYDAPPTILISSAEIVSFEYVGPANEIRRR